MTRTLADILREALADADRRGIRSPTLDRLNNSDVQLLAEQTLAFLRTRPSTESTIPGWRQVGSFEAGVNRWWNEQIDSPITSDTAVRLRKLRMQTYDYLDDELGLISKAPVRMRWSTWRRPVRFCPRTRSMTRRVNLHRT